MILALYAFGEMRFFSVPPEFIGYHGETLNLCSDIPEEQEVALDFARKLMILHEDVLLEDQGWLELDHKHMDCEHIWIDPSGEYYFAGNFRFPELEDVPNRIDIAAALTFNFGDTHDCGHML